MSGPGGFTQGWQKQILCLLQQVPLGSSQQEKEGDQKGVNVCFHSRDVTGECPGLLLVSFLFSILLYPQDRWLFADVSGLFVVIRVRSPSEEQQKDLSQFNEERRWKMAFIVSNSGKR